MQDLERLLHEALEQLRWNADSKQLADRVERLHGGLPLEDEFSVLLGWLGKTNLIHKLDQQPYPNLSKTDYQVPDLLVIFQYDNKPIPVLIEVKSKQENTLSFTPDYVRKLKNYSKVLNLPILIAWKNKAHLWTLNCLDNFIKKIKNYNLGFNESMQFSLMGILAGDFAYKVSDGVGFHFELVKKVS